jgi:glycerol-3-phosphate acyltransferase PlsX
MTRPVTIALDAMGGDHGPSVVIPGAAMMLERRPDCRFVIFGDEKQVLPLIDQHPRLKAVTTFHHTEVSVKMDDKPSQALRYGRYKSSMWRAIDATKTGEADVTVSAGNTGALMAMSKFCLKSMPQVDRPALAGLWPTARGESIVLDLGATIGADARHLVDLAVMGAAMARVVFDLDRPTVGLLNVGVEEIKGVEAVKEAGRILRESDLPHLSYHGFVEGDDLGKGTVDVVVTEGFTGNIALKTAEGTAKLVGQFLRRSLKRSLLGQIGAFIASGALNTLRRRLDPRAANGGIFLGLGGVVVKSHGGTDAIGFASALDMAIAMAKADINTKIAADRARVGTVAA